MKTSPNRSPSLVFSIMCTARTGSADSIQLTDQTVTMLAAYPDLPAEKIQKSE